MPWKNHWVEPKQVFQHAGVTIYHTYRDNEFSEGPDRYCFVCEPADQESESQFDIRSMSYPLSGPTLRDEPESVGFETWNKYGFISYDDWKASEKYTHLRSQWDAWNESGYRDALENHFCHIIDAGLLDEWRVVEEPEPLEYPVLLCGTFRAYCETTVEAIDEVDAVQKAKSLDFSGHHFSTENGTLEGDEIARVQAPVGVADWADDIEVDRRESGEVFSWDACNLTQSLADEQLPQDLFETSPQLQNKYSDIDEMIADMSDDQLIDAFAKFQHYVERARTLRAPSAG